MSDPDIKDARWRILMSSLAEMESRSGWPIVVSEAEWRILGDQLERPQYVRVRKREAGKVLIGLTRLGARELAAWKARKGDRPI